MSKIQILRSLVTERLAAAAEEIFGLFERTLTEYEGEIDRQRKLLHVLTPGMRTDLFPPQLSVCEEEDPSEQQERSPSLDQEESEPPQIKEEQKELWSSQRGEQLQGLEEAEVKWTSTPVPVKREHDEEEPQCSWFNQTQPEESREAEPLPRTSTEHMETQPGGDEWAAPEPARTSRPSVGSEPTTDVHLLSSDFPRPDTKDSDELVETTEPQLGLKSLKSSCHISIMNSHCLREQSSPHMVSRNRRIKMNYRDRGLFDRHVERAESLNPHLEAHNICSVYDEEFSRNIDIVTHMRSLPGERPFTCSVCGKEYKWKVHLQRHFRCHSNEKPFSCAVCGKRFSQSSTVKIHMRTHTKEKPFSCSLCGKRFSQRENLKTHLRTHTNERPFSCSLCGKRFSRKGNLQTHIQTHTNERPFCCSQCGKKFTRRGNLKTHMKVHSVALYTNQA